MLSLLPLGAHAEDVEGDAPTQPARPTLLSIPAAQVRAPVEAVGLDDLGAVEAPRSFWTVAWYGDGALPGGPGNAVITGHVSTVGGPAVFSHLHELVPGDEIQVAMSDGQVLRYSVRSVESFAFDDPEPMPRIYGLAWTPRLNLITCDGEWDPVAQNYDRRLVVFAELPFELEPEAHDEGP